MTPEFHSLLLAVSLWWSTGMGGNTVDVDLVIRLDRQSVLNAFEALAKLGYRPRVPISAESFADSMTRKRLIEENKMQVLNFWSNRHRDTPLDIFVSEPFDFALEHEQAQIREPSPGLPVRIVQLSTLFEMKKAAGRPKDLADIDELSLLHGLPSSYDKENEPEIDWSLCTWKGSRRKQHQEFYALPFGEKLSQIEEMNDLAVGLSGKSLMRLDAQSRRSEGLTSAVREEPPEPGHAPEKK
jgi:hypothetical protein